MTTLLDVIEHLAGAATRAAVAAREHAHSDRELWAAQRLETIAGDLTRFVEEFRAAQLFDDLAELAALDEVPPDDA